MSDLLATQQEQRVRREGEIAVDLAGVDGVAGALRAEEHQGWFVIEMKRYEKTLADHLRDRDEDRESRRIPEEYARLLSGVAVTLRRLHRQGVVHRDIKPSNLFFSDNGARLLVADFSVAYVRGSDLTQASEVLGTERYLAPECWDGTVSPASDQYALGMVARETFSGQNSPSFPVPLAKAIRKATASDPQDRFPGSNGTEDFGLALVAAVDRDAPRSLGDRLRNVSADWRYAWAPAAIAATATYLEVLFSSNPTTLPFVETLAMPFLAGLATLLLFRLLNLGRGRRGTVSGWRLLDQWWLPLALSALAIASLNPLWSTPDSKDTAGTWITGIIVVTFLGTARVGAYPVRTGWWAAQAADFARDLTYAWPVFRRAPVQYVLLAFLVLALALAPSVIGDLRGVPSQ